MALFPTSPSNGQQTTVNGILYTYSSAQTAWIRTGSSLSQGDLTVNGNITVSGNSILGSNANVRISGGTSGYVLSTDGNSNLSWVAQSGGGAASISNGTSNVNISTSGGNVTTSVAGNANVLVVTGTGANVNGTVQATRYVSNIANGTAPLLVTSTTLVANLNADYVDGYQAATAATANTVAARDGNGNVSANYFIGNGSQLTGIITSVSNVSNGTSNLNIPAASGNVNISAAGNANILVVTGTGANVAGTFTVNGNIIGANIYANSGTIGAGNIAGTITSAFASQPNITSLGTLTGLGVNGNITAANITANTGRFIGNANGLTNIPGANVTGTVPAATTAGTVTTAAQPNITSVGNLTTLNVAGNIRTNSSMLVDDILYVGIVANALAYASPAILAAGSDPVYVQSALVNQNANGSADIAAFGDNGNDLAGWMDMGFTGSNFADPTYSITEPNDGYLFVQPQGGFGGNLVLATGNNGTVRDIVFATGGFTSSNEKMRFYDAGNQFQIKVDTVSTSNTTGALVVSGGAGIEGNLHIGGELHAQGNTVVGDLLVNGNANITGLSVTDDLYANAGNVFANYIYSSNNIIANANVYANNSLFTNNVYGVTGNVMLMAPAGNNSVSIMPTGTGVVDVANARITQVGYPAAGTDAATKQYVDNAVSTGIHIHSPVRVVATTALNATYAQGGTTPTVTTITSNSILTTSAAHGLSVNDMIVFNSTTNGLTAGTAYFVYSVPSSTQITLSLAYGPGTQITSLTNGTGLTITSRANSGVGATLTNAGTQAALSISGVALSVSDRVLVLAQANAAHNGVYTVTNIGSGSTNWVLTRATDQNKYSPQDPQGMGAGDYFFVQAGTDAGESYVMTTEGVVIIGTTNVEYTLFSASIAYSAGTGLSLANTTFSIANTTVTAGTYGNSTNIPTFTVNEQGQITAASNNAVVANAATLVGTTLNSSVVTSSLTSVGTLGNLDVSGNVTASRIISNVASGTAPFVVTSTTVVANLTAESATTAGTVTTASQPNITSVGTLSSLDVSGNISAGNASASGNITAAFFIGNGSQLTGVVASGPSISNGNSNVNIPAANGNVNISAVGNANVAVISGTGANITGTLGVSSNITGANVTANANVVTPSITTSTTNGNLTIDPNGTGFAVFTTTTPVVIANSTTQTTAGLQLTGDILATNNDFGLLHIGNAGLTFNDTNIISAMTANANSYAQMILQNKSANNTASADFIVNNDTSSGATVYGDFGINSTTFAASGPFGGANTTYVYSSGGNLGVGTLTTNSMFLATANTTRITIDSSGNTSISGNVTVSVGANANVLSITGSTVTLTKPLTFSDATIQYKAAPNITVGTSAPTSPSIGDLWVDTN